MLPGEEPAGAADTGLDLIQHEQQVVLVADRSQRGQVALVGDVDAAFALQRLDEDGSRLGTNGGAHRLDVVERHVAEAVERSERLSISRIAGGIDGGQGATVEGLIHDDDVGRAVAPRLAPLAADLDRAFGSLCAAVAEEDPGHAGLLENQVGEVELGDRIEVVGDVEQGLGLGLDCIDDARMAVAEVVGGDPGDEVEVLVALVVPDFGSFATHERDGQTPRRHHEDGRLALGSGGHGRNSGNANGQGQSNSD